MDIDKDYIEQLSLDELAGTITIEEREYLYSIIATNKVAQQVYAAVNNQYSPERLKGIETDLAQKLPVASILSSAKGKMRRALYIRYATGIAATIILTIGIFSWFRYSNTMISDVRNSSLIQLQIEGQQPIDLSKQGRIVIGGIILNNNNKTLQYSSSTDHVTTKWAKLIVPPGKDYTLVLQDGSEIQINVATILKFPLQFVGSTREIFVQGEAYLKVAKDPAKPFIVHLPNSRVSVLGTMFNVNSYDSTNVKVALVEGSIKMVALNDSIILKPGYAITYQSKKDLQISAFDERETLSWRKGVFIFHDKTLRELIEVLPLWLGVPVIIDNPAIVNRRFTGIINRNQSLEETFEILKSTNGLDYSIKGDGVHLR